MTPNYNFEKPFECLKIELETIFFPLSAVVLKIQHEKVDVIKSQDVCSINSSYIDNNYSLKSLSICYDKCNHIFHLRK